VFSIVKTGRLTLIMDVVEQEMASRTMKRVAQRTTSTYMRSSEASIISCYPFNECRELEF